MGHENFDFTDLILEELRGNEDGMIWSELKVGLDLPYRTPCPEWVNRMERENDLVKVRKRGRSLIWELYKKDLSDHCMDIGKIY